MQKTAKSGRKKHLGDGKEKLWNSPEYLLLLRLYFYLLQAWRRDEIPNPKTVMITKEDNGKIITVSEGVILEVRLEQSGGTWLTWGSTSYYDPPASYTTNFFSYTLQGFKRAFLDYYAGMTHDSFWGLFGWVDTPLVIRGRNTTEAVQFIIQVFAWVILGLTLWRLEQVGSRLVRLSGRGRRGLRAAPRLLRPAAERLLSVHGIHVLHLHPH